MFAQPKREHHTRSNIVLEYARDYATGVRVVASTLVSVSTSRPRMVSTPRYTVGGTREYIARVPSLACVSTE